jgi:WD40 repeat protein
MGLLEGHNGWVTSIVVGEKPDGSPLLISGSRDKNIIIWDLHLNDPQKVVIKEADDDEPEIVDMKVGKPLKSSFVKFLFDLTIRRLVNSFGM